MAMQWVLTWARTAFISISRKNVPPPLEHAAFDSQTEAVNFAMSLTIPNGGRCDFICPAAILPSLQFLCFNETRAEQLYPRASNGAPVIIDDYGAYAGARKATSCSQ
jgi:hypothetical protein